MTIKEDKRQAVVTLKDQDWFVKSVIKGMTDCLVMSQATSGIQVFMADRKYYAEFGTDQRSGIQTLNGQVKSFDVAASTDCSDGSFRKAVVAVLAEKIFNDLNSVKALVDHMKQDGILPPEFDHVGVKDIQEYMAKPKDI